MACWAHARRKFFEIHETTGSPIAEEALRRIQMLYAIEAQITGSSPEARRAIRQAEAVPLLASFKAWLEDQRRRLSAKSALAKAIGYALARWSALTCYAGEGRYAIDNNPAERALRGIAVTRKNYLFLGSQTGGERAATLYTIIETARMSGLDPQGYIANIIDRMAMATPLPASMNCRLGIGTTSTFNLALPRSQPTLTDQGASAPQVNASTASGKSGQRKPSSAQPRLIKPGLFSFAAKSIKRLRSAATSASGWSDG